MNRYTKLTKNIPSLYQPTVNTFIKGLLQAWGKGLDDLDIAVDATNKQLFVPTAEGDYLKRLASNVGVVLPTQIGISDADNRSIIKTMSFNPKQVRQTIWNLLETFYTTAGVYANITSISAETYLLVNGYTIEFLVDGSEHIIITFSASDFEDITAATAFEVANAINKQALNSQIKAEAYYDYASNKSYVRVFTLSAGSFGSIAVIGGLAQYILQFPVVRDVANGTTTEWDIAIYYNDIVRMEWTGSGLEPDFNPLQFNDLLILSGIFNVNNIGTFTITDITIGGTVDGITPGLKYTGTYVEFSNPIAVNQTITQTLDSDVVFYYPYKAQITELPVYATEYETSHKEVIIAIPSTSPIVARNTLGCTHLHPCISLNNLTVIDVNGIGFEQFEDIVGCDAMYLSSGGTGDFEIGKTITGSTSLKTAIVKSVIKNAINDTILAVESISGGFTVGEPVTSGTITLPAKLFTKLSGVAAARTRGYGVAVDQSTGDIYIAGYTAGNLDGQIKTGTYDMFLKKYNSSGVLQWTKLNGVTGKETAGTTVKVAVDGASNIYVCGYTLGALNGEVFHGTEDGFVCKYNSSGVRQWTKLTGIGGKATVANGISVDTAGNVYVTGYTGGNIDGQIITGTNDLWIKKYNTAGTAQWTYLNGVAGTLISGNDIIVEPGGANVYVVGNSRGNLNGETGLGMYDACLIKYNSAGVRQWTRLSGIAGGYAVTSAYGVTLDTSNNIYMVGSVSLNGGAPALFDGQTLVGNYDGYLIKYDSTPTKLWTKLSGTTPGGTMYWQGVGVDASGNIFLNGRTDSNLDGETKTGYTDSVYAQYDSSGTKTFTRLSGVSGAATIGYALSVEQSTGKICLAGRTNGALDGEVYVGTEDGYLIKYTKGGGSVTATRNFDILKSTSGASATISSVLGFNSMLGLDNLSSKSFQVGEAIIGRTVFKTGAVTGSGFRVGEIITGTTSGATARIEELIFVERSYTIGTLIPLSGYFTTGEVITGSTSGSTSTMRRIETSSGIIEAINSITEYQSGYVYNSLSPFILLDTYSLLTQAITAGSSYDLLQCDIVSSDFPTSGSFIIDYGLGTQEGPVPFYLTPGETTIRIDPSFVFQYNHAIGSYVRTIKSIESVAVTDQYGLDYPVYITGIDEARLAFQDLVRNLIAAGITIRFIITYPIYRFMDYEFVSILVKQYYIPQVQNVPTPENEYFIYSAWNSGSPIIPGDDVGRGYDQIGPTPAGHIGGGKLKKI